MESSDSRLRERELAKRKRERWTIAILVLLVVASLILEFKLIKLSSTLPFVNSIFFFGLINFNVILLLFIAFLVYRNVGKLFLERRRKLFGSQLKTKLVFAFLSFSLIPTIILFTIGAFYINSSFDKWFSIKIGNTLQNSLDITESFYTDARDSATHFSNLLKKEFYVWSEKHDDYRSLSNYVKDKALLYGLDSVEFYIDPLSPRFSYVNEKFQDSNLPRISIETYREAIKNTKPQTVIQSLPGGEVVRSLVSIPTGDFPILQGSLSDRALLSVARFIPRSLTDKATEIAGTIDDYRGVNPLKYPIKSIYLILLAMITLLIAFAAIWVGLYLAKELTGPIARLAAGTQQVAAGNLDYKIPNPGRDEISQLVESFNKMTGDLKKNRKALEEAHQNLLKSNLNLEQGKIYIETLIKNVAAGVISLNSLHEVATINKSAEELLGCQGDWAVGKNASEVFPSEFEDLIPSLSEEPGKTKQGFIRVKSKTTGEVKSVIVKVTTLGDREVNTGNLGAVFVFEDITNLIKAQREAAWREVARRIAHEIKNPLTPIKLSAQRLQKRFSEEIGEDRKIFEECTQTIINQVDGLKNMVNEFSSFARFPTANPVPQNLNRILEGTLPLYREAHKDIQFEERFEKELPLVEVDAEQIKRVLINLLDNAVGALTDLEEENPKIITVGTTYHSALQLVRITVSDNGPGISDEAKERIFEPYYTTKSQGTGLGLAIVHRIVSDHSGFIRVQSELGKGTTFLIELPLDAGLAKPAKSQKTKSKPLVS